MTPYEYDTKSRKRYYRVAYRTPDGHQHNKRGFTTKTAARAWYCRKMVEIENHGFSNSDHVTFGEVAKRWLDNKRHLVAGATYRKYLSDYRNHLLPDLGDKRLKDFNLSFCQSIVYQWHDEMKSYNKLLADAINIFDLAIKNKLIHDNPFKLVDRPKREYKKPTKSFTLSEFHRFNRALHDYYEPTNYQAFTFLFVLAHTGLRKGELSALTWNDIDFQKGILHIKKAVTRDRNDHLVIGKTKNVYSIRDVPIADQTIKILQTWRLKQREQLRYFNINTIKPGQLVFTNLHGGILTPPQPGKWLKALEKRYDLPLYVTPHGLRHTYTCLLIDQGVNVNKVAAILGHKDASITISVYNDLHPVKDNSIGKIIENL